MEAKLLKNFRQLDDARQQACLDYVMFLTSQQNKENTPVLQQPIESPKAENETVIGAIKRLSDSYPMLERDKMLEPVNQLMNEHLLHGKDTLSVIEQIELLFKQQYEVYCQEFKKTHSNAS